MKAIIDRIEGKMAVLRFGGQELIIHRRFLPKNIREGDILTASFVLDKRARRKKAAAAAGLLEKILGKQP